MLEDINPNNILINDVETASPEVKLADLGCCVYNSGNHLRKAKANLSKGIAVEELPKGLRAQGLAIRAPEVWGGAICGQKADVWSVGVSVSSYSYLFVLLFAKPCQARTLACWESSSRASRLSRGRRNGCVVPGENNAPARSTQTATESSV